MATSTNEFPSQLCSGGIDCTQSRVVKRMAPTQAGAIKLAERFGESLVCVRYRHDTTGNHRYTTVELVIESGPIKHRSARIPRVPQNLKIVTIRLTPHEQALRKVLQAQGAMWAPQAGVWYVTFATAKALDLLHRVV